MNYQHANIILDIFTFHLVKLSASKLIFVPYESETRSVSEKPKIRFRLRLNCLIKMKKEVSATA